MGYRSTYRYDAHPIPVRRRPDPPSLRPLTDPPTLASQVTKREEAVGLGSERAEQEDASKAEGWW